jgi:chorismate mutase
MEAYNSHISKLDNEIIELLSIRQGLLINTKNFKVLELGGYNLKHTFVSKIDHNIFKYELQFQNNKTYSYKKLFNENLDTHIEDYETLNLSRIIKQSYLIFLYDLCEYGDDEQNEFCCNLDMELLFKVSERIHFGYEIIKLKYLENIDFYDKLFQSSDSSLILYYLSNCIYQPTYLDILKEKCIEHNICDILVCSFYKNIILPYYNEIQLNFCLNIKKIKKIKNIKNIT